MSEAFRILNNNIQHELYKSGDTGKGACFFVTSTIKGEGKTFTTINLAMTMARGGERVLVVGFDLRNPQLNQYAIDGKSLPGVSNYLKNNQEHLESLITDSKLHPNLKLLLSGPIPTNPSELLRKKKVGELFNEIRGKFDYIIVDTAPSMLVADTFIINNHSDLLLYVVRAGYTKKKMLDFVADAQADKKLTNALFILNDVKLSELGYGNKYGYTYGQERPNAIKLLRISLKDKLNYLMSLFTTSSVDKADSGTDLY
ncbi:tyrosine-protein kinase family protein [Pelagihabitans pacificus]